MDGSLDRGASGSSPLAFLLPPFREEIFGHHTLTYIPAVSEVTSCIDFSSIQASKPSWFNTLISPSYKVTLNGASYYASYSKDTMCDLVSNCFSISQ